MADKSELEDKVYYGYIIIHGANDELEQRSKYGLLESRGYKIKDVHVIPESGVFNSIIWLDRELDVESIRELKKAGYRVFREISAEDLA